jgi:hypothetical protein
MGTDIRATGCDVRVTELWYLLTYLFRSSYTLRCLVFFMFIILQTVGLLGREISSSQGLYLNTNRINTYTYQTSMTYMVFEPMIPASERGKNSRLPWPAVVILHQKKWSTVIKVWWSEGIDPLIRYLGTGWRSVVSFTLRPLCLGGKIPLNRKVGEPQSRCEVCREEKTLTMAGNRARTVQPLTHPYTDPLQSPTRCHVIEWL